MSLSTWCWLWCVPVLWTPGDDSCEVLQTEASPELAQLLSLPSTEGRQEGSPSQPISLQVSIIPWDFLEELLSEFRGLGWHQGTVSHAAVDGLMLKAHFCFITEGFSKISSLVFLGFEEGRWLRYLR